MINDKIPGGVGSLEKLRGDSIENILGLNEFTKKFDEVKNTAKFEDVKKMLTGGGFGNVVQGIGSIF